MKKKLLMVFAVIGLLGMSSCAEDLEVPSERTNTSLNTKAFLETNGVIIRFVADSALYERAKAKPKPAYTAASNHDCISSQLI